MTQITSRYSLCIMAETGRKQRSGARGPDPGRQAAPGAVAAEGGLVTAVTSVSEGVASQV